LREIFGLEKLNNRLFVP